MDQHPHIIINCGKVPKQKMPEPKKKCCSGTEKCVKPMKIPEMRGGYLYSQCGCIHRNGLQDSCPLSGCQGQPKCMIKPWPICEPGIYYRSKNHEFLDRAPQKIKEEKCPQY